MNANWALQKGIYETLSQNPQVTGLLGGPYIHDGAPRATRFPYMTFGQTVDYDWSTGSEDGREHTLTLHIWSRANGRKEVIEIIEAVNAALADASIALPGHALVNLQFQFAEARRDPDGETLHGIIRFRAVTEPLN